MQPNEAFRIAVFQLHQRRAVARQHLDPQLFVQFTHQTLHLALAGLEFAAGEFPETGQRLTVIPPPMCGVEK